MLVRVKKLYETHEPACTVGFFVAGFLFDTLAVGRIDRMHNIIHQAIYLFLCALFTGLELREEYGDFSPPERIKTFWRYHTGATHFMLGTLLNIYALFYFKSASLSTSFIFLLIIVIFLMINELKPVKTSGTTMRMVLFSLCLISYFTYLIPMLVGSIGTFPFLGSMVTATGAIWILVQWLRLHLPTHLNAIRRHVLMPFIAVLLIFAGLYFAKLIPPVPLSISSIGIYHDVRRVGEHVALTTTHPQWRFWEYGDQHFLARPGDVIHCFVSVFSPIRFKERLQVRWLFWTHAGWQESDVIPLDIVGGRGGGFRADIVKTHYEPGLWRVRVETSDMRELGRLDLTVIADTASFSRRTRTVVR